LLPQRLSHLAFPLTYLFNGAGKGEGTQELVEVWWQHYQVGENLETRGCVVEL